MISNARSYIKSQIASVDSDLKENKSAFYDNDIGEVLIDRSYQITIDTIVNTLRTEFRHYEVPTTVSIFGRGYREEITNYDALLDKALCILDNIISLQNFNNVDYIFDVTGGSINSSQLDGDDNGFKIDINFTINLAYTS